MNILGQAKEQATYDAIVIGSGMSGGWAAKELCDHGLKTLVLERGREVKHLVDYPTATKDPWDFPYRGRLPHEVIASNPIAARCYAFNDTTQHFFVKDDEHPYIQEKPFDWIRGYQTGGKSLLWARTVQRWSRFEFEAPGRDGFAVDWPIRYEDLAPWYSYVEKFAGISGNRDGIETMPDSEVMKAFEMNCVEEHIREKITDKYKDRDVIVSRCAHVTEPQEIHKQQGRGQCQARTLCERGCPYGGYFSANSSTLPWAMKTGNMVLRPFSVVHSIIYDDKKGKATGVRVVDTNTHEMTEYFARIIFVNAACLNSNLLLLNSTSGRFPDGLGNDNGLLGKYVAFHNYRGSVSATFEGYEDSYYYGRRPNAVAIPSFRNVRKQEEEFVRGYMSFYSASRMSSYSGAIGTELKESMAKPGKLWHVSMMMQGETIPIESNHVRLSADKKDAWGVPLLITSVGYTDNDEKMLADFLTQAQEMLDTGGCKNIVPNDSKQAPGLDIHEVGGVRMGRDPRTSLLNKWNQFHNCKNVFVTDGACMTSTGCQNPSLTFMAITARAANYAVDEMKKGAL
jgi:choline dehydrogenase-like flavoprotein